MLRWLICILIAPALAIGQTAPLPFWKAKEKVYSRIENGEIIVSVSSTPPKMLINGGGQVNAPRDFVFEYAREFEHIDHLGIYVDKAHYNAEKQTVDMTMSMLGRTADFVVGVKSFAEAEPRRIEFTILEGPVKGLKGVLNFTSLKAEKCEVGITGEYDYTDQKMMKFLLGFGLEVVFQKMAARLRSQVLSAWHESREKAGAK